MEINWAAEKGGRVLQAKRKQRGELLRTLLSGGGDVRDSRQL